MSLSIDPTSFLDRQKNCSAVVDGLMQAQMETGVPVFSLSLTPHQYQETAFHNETYIKHMYNKGEETAGAVAMQLETLAKLSSQMMT